MAIRNYFSGVEGKQHFQACVDAGAKHVLTSFLYVDKQDRDIVKKRKQAHPHLRFMIDSGAHTIQSDKAGYSKWSLADFEAYLKRYVKWLRDNKDYIECAVELDIDYNVGTNVVEAWQQKYFIPLLEEGMEIIFVWHHQRGMEAFEQMCQRFAYVGLPGEFSSEPDFNKYMTVAKRYCTKVHGFAATKQADFRDWPWFSGDSTTWKSSERYGTLIHWDEHAQQIVFEEDKSKRALYRKDFERYQLDADGIIGDTNYREVTKYALISMRRMEEFYEQKYKERTFYYEMRLPHPNHVLALGQAEVARWWKLYRPDALFKAHAAEPSWRQHRIYLAAIAAIQYREHGLLGKQPAMQDFLAAYWPKLIRPQLADPTLLQKEIVAYCAPSNPPPLARVDATHYIASNNPAKTRDRSEFTLADLEHDYTKSPILNGEL